MRELVNFTYKHGFTHSYPVNIRVWVDGRQLWRSDDGGAPFLVGTTIREIGMELNKWPFSEAGKRVFEAARTYERMDSYLDLRLSAPEDLDDVKAAERAFWDVVADIQKPEAIAC